MPSLSSDLIANLKRRKLLISLTVAMLTLFLFIFLIHASNSREIASLRNYRNEKHELKLVHVVGVNFLNLKLIKIFKFKQFFRHGARTPADTYPNDKYLNETFFPYGWGQLTNVSLIL